MRYGVLHIENVQRYGLALLVAAALVLFDVLVRLLKIADALECVRGGSIKARL